MATGHSCCGQAIVSTDLVERQPLLCGPLEHRIDADVFGFRSRVRSADDAQVYTIRSTKSQGNGEACSGSSVRCVTASVVHSIIVRRRLMVLRTVTALVRRYNLL